MNVDDKSRRSIHRYYILFVFIESILALFGSKSSSSCRGTNRLINTCVSRENYKFSCRVRKRFRVHRERVGRHCYDTDESLYPFSFRSRIPGATKAHLEEETTMGRLDKRKRLLVDATSFFVRVKRDRIIAASISVNSCLDESKEGGENESKIVSDVKFYRNKKKRCVWKNTTNSLYVMEWRIFSM